MKAYTILVLLFLLAACSKDSTPTTQTAADGNPQRGKSIYLSNCAACHNSDPAKDGSVGPAIQGSPRALIEARVLQAGYPSDYTPKRKTTIMPAQPYLKSAIPDLAAFLNQP